MEHRQVEMRQSTSGRSSGDDPARFLKELRQLRDGAGLGPAELAARAHYPYDRIRAAEAGPSLPDLPVLSAYVRGCGGTTEEWEERWRSLTSAQTLPLLSARPAGSSTAASAGARIGSISPAADTPDPSIILAALDRVAEEMAVGHPAPTALAPPTTPLPVRSGVPAIEQRPGGAPGAPNSTGAKPGAGKQVGGKAGASVASASAATAGAAAASLATPAVTAAAAAAAAAASKPNVWETTTTRAPWGTAGVPTAWGAADRAAADAEPATSAAETIGAKATGAEAAGAGATQAKAAEAGATQAEAAGAGAPVAGPGVTSTQSPDTRSPDSTPTASEPAPAAPASATPAGADQHPDAGASTASSGLVVSGWTGPALSRTTILAAIALVICALVAALVVFG